MKRKLNKAAWELLHSEVKALYKLDGEDYVLQLETSADDDPAELRRARDREKETARLEKARADKAEADLSAVTNADARRAGDINTLETSWKEKERKAKEAHDAEVARLTKIVNTTLVDAKATQLAFEIAGDNAEVIKPHILSRLTADLTGETPQTRVLDAAGKPSALTLDELKKEFVDNKKFSSIVVVSNASGGAAGGNRGSSSGVPKDKKFSEMTDAERTAFYKSDPEGFKKASEADKVARASANPIRRI